MSGNPRGVPRFWHELKRRKVIQVIPVYAASAFMVLELVDMITEPFGLPDWTFKLVLILLSVGFVIAVILSWIYDIHPEEGIVKTKSEDSVGEGKITTSSNGWKIASYLSFVVIAGLIIWNILPRLKSPAGEVALDKSVAVLPFHNDSPDLENEYFINGTMESILNNLCKVNDLRVISRTSVEQFRDKSVEIPEVSKMLNVSYILEGSMQKYGNRIRITTQLIDQNDNHVWSEQYDREISAVEDLIDIQSEIAQLVAQELNAVITPVEKQRIEATPTHSMDAYEYYLLGEQLLFAGAPEKDYLKAIEYFEESIKLDSSFAQAYIGLGYCYGNLAFLGSLRPAVAYPWIKSLGEKVIRLDPMSGKGYELIAIVDYFYHYDFENAEQHIVKAQALEPNNPKFYRTYAEFCTYQGIFQKAMELDRRAISLDPLYPYSNVLYSLHLYYGGERDSAFSLLETLSIRYEDVKQWMGFLYLQEGKYEDAILQMGKLEDVTTPFALVQYGVATSRSGHPEIAQKALDILETRAEDEFISYTLRGALLAELGKDEKALDYLRKGYEEREEYILMLMHFDTIAYGLLRSDPGFQDVMRRVQHGADQD